MNRRDVLKSAALTIAGAGLLAADVGAVTDGPEPQASNGKVPRMPFVEAADGTSIFYRDWGAGQPVLFINNWGLDSQMWQYQMVPLINQGVRCGAYDRRGTGRSTVPWRGYDYDTLADDLASIIEQRDLNDVVLVSHSMGAGEVVRYLSRRGTGRVSRIVLIAPTTPFLLKTRDNPDGLDRSGFDEMRAASRKGYPKWIANAVKPYFAKGTSLQMMQWVANLALQCPLKTAIDLSYAWSETDFREELPKIKLPALIIQGDKDTLPIDLTGQRTAPLIKGSQFKVYEGEAHGLMFTSTDRLNRDLLSFLKG
jgi:non-heme chloroperoxidase